MIVVALGEVNPMRPQSYDKRRSLQDRCVRKIKKSHSCSANGYIGIRTYRDIEIRPIYTGIIGLFRLDNKKENSFFEEICRDFLRMCNFCCIFAAEREKERIQYEYNTNYY